MVEAAGATVRVYRRRFPGSMGYLVATLSSSRRRADRYTSEAETIEAADRVARQIAAGQVAAAELTPRQAVEYATARKRLDPLGLELVPAVEIVAEAARLTDGLPAVLEAARL